MMTRPVGGPSQTPRHPHTAKPYPTNQTKESQVAVNKMPKIVEGSKKMPPTELAPMGNVKGAQHAFNRTHGKK